MAILVAFVDDYFNETSIHGFNYLHSKNKCIVKSLWLIIATVGFGFAAYMISSSMTEWESNPVITTLDSIAAPIKLVQFPTVTVCPEALTPPDNWAYPELILNGLAFECYQEVHGDLGIYPDCESAASLREDYKDLIKEMADTLRGMMASNNFEGMRVVNARFLNLETSVKTLCLVRDKKLSLNDISTSTQKEFGRQSNSVRAMDLITNFTGYTRACCDYSCLQKLENLHNVVNLYSTTMRIMLATQLNMPFGSLLVHFLNATGAADTFDFHRQAKESSNELAGQFCKNMNKVDSRVHELFGELSELTGFDKRLSLFDIPSMVAAMSWKRAMYPSNVDIFPVSHCNYKQEIKAYLDCTSRWINAFVKDKHIKDIAHPCDPDGGVTRCCGFWTSQMNQNLTALFRVMRVASRRGQNLIDIGDLLQPYLQWERYPFNKVGVGYYKSNRTLDPSSYIKDCSYAGRIQTYLDGRKTHDCRLFEPVPTDSGICYSFNAKTANSILEESPFKSAFLNAYKTEINLTRPVTMGVGTGSSLALDFVLDNNALKRLHVEPFPFRIGIGSVKDVFTLRATAKLIKPGYKLEYNVYPTEVVATERLSDISQEKRRCLFTDEKSGYVEMFKEYSQAACQFECMLKFARSLCHCTPWNMPFPPDQNPLAICDFYGNVCFEEMMNENRMIENCDCPVDCNTVKFTINEKEVKIDPDDYCTMQDSRGLSLFVRSEKYTGSTLLYSYQMLQKKELSNETEYNKIYHQCVQMMRENVALVSVNFGANTYMRTVMDKKFTFSDQLGSLGGTLGLFTGMSLVSVTELVFWFLRGIWNVVLTKDRK